MFGIGGFELFLILIFGFLIFGPDKLPAIAKTIGKAIAKFRDAQEEMTGQLKKESFIDKDSDAPFKNPLDVIESTAKDVKRGVNDAQSKADAVTDAVVNGVAGATSGVAASASGDQEHVASFAERKARYDCERAARKEAEAKAAREEAAKAAEAQAAEKEKKDNPKAPVSSKRVVEAADDEAAASDHGPAGEAPASAPAKDDASERKEGR